MDEKRRAAGQKLLDAALEFFHACRDEGQSAAVQWLRGSDGSLVIFTRGEYRHTLMANIDRLADVGVHHFSGEAMPALTVSEVNERDALSAQLTITNDQLCRDQAKLAEAEALLRRWSEPMKLPHMATLVADTNAFLNKEKTIAECTCGSLTSQRLFGGHDVNCPRHGEKP